MKQFIRLLDERDDRFMECIVGLILELTMPEKVRAGRQTESDDYFLIFFAGYHNRMNYRLLRNHPNI